MKYDITINSMKYVVEIDNETAKVLQKIPVEQKAQEQQFASDIPDFDFGEEVEGAAVVKAALPGTVIAIKVHCQETVEKGTVLAIVESMKMENAIVAPESGKIESILVQEGTAVKKDQELFRIAS